MKNILAGIGITLVVVGIVVVILVLTGVIKMGWSNAQKDEFRAMISTTEYGQIPPLVSCMVENASKYYSFKEMKEVMQDRTKMTMQILANLVGGCGGKRGAWTNWAKTGIIYDAKEQIYGPDQAQNAQLPPECSNCIISKMEPQMNVSDCLTCSSAPGCDDNLLTQAIADCPCSV